MEKKRGRIINAILFIVFILTILAILYLTKSDVLKPKEIVIPEVIPNSGYKVIEVEELEKKLNKLSFVNKKQDFYNKSSKININTSVTAGKLNVLIKIGKVKKTYTVDELEKIICVHTNVYDNKHISYILTEDGKVYKIEDDLSIVKKTDDYKGEAVDLGLTNVVKIAVDKKLKFKINSELKTIIPSVYIKTDDNRVFTNEVFFPEEKIVELVEKPIENENASQNN